MPILVVEEKQNLVLLMCSQQLDSQEKMFPLRAFVHTVALPYPETFHAPRHTCAYLHVSLFEGRSVADNFRYILLLDKGINRRGCHGLLQYSCGIVEHRLSKSPLCQLRGIVNLEAQVSIHENLRLVP